VCTSTRARTDEGMTAVNNKGQPRRALPATEKQEKRSRGKGGLVVLIALVVLVAGGVGAYFVGWLDPLISRLPFISSTEPTDEPTTAQIKGEWPLTGIAFSGDIASHPAVVMEIENSADNRPLAGVEDADLVVEEAAGDNTTRLSAVFHSSMPSDVSSLGRLTATNEPMWPQGYVVLRGDHVPSAYTPEPNSPAPEPLAQFDAAGMGGTAQWDGNMTNDFSILFPGGAQPHWTWDVDDLEWMRFEGDQPALTASGTQIAVSNVIVINAAIDKDSPGPIPTVELVGEGTAFVASGQMVAEIRWKRESRASMWQFFNAAGDPIVMPVGKTWIEVLPIGQSTVTWN